MQQIEIFTDGASKGNPGSGGWGAVILYEDTKKVVELGDREEETTNNRMELRAILEALRKVATEKGVQKTIYTDSRYAVNGITKWVHGWKKNGWQTKDKKDVLNRDLWEEIDRVIVGQKVVFEVVGGHVGISGNERADDIASDFGANQAPDLYEGALADYSIDLTDVNLDEAQKEKKDEKKKRADMKAYSYLSLVDGVFQKHKTWAECEARVKGQQGAKFRKAISKEDEEAIINEWGV